MLLHTVHIVQSIADDEQKKENAQSTGKTNRKGRAARKSELCEYEYKHGFLIFLMHRALRFNSDDDDAEAEAQWE